MRTIRATGPLEPPDTTESVLADIRKVLGDLQQILEILHQRGQQDSPVYSELQQMARELTESLRQARSRGPGKGV